METQRATVKRGTEAARAVMMEEATAKQWRWRGSPLEKPTEVKKVTKMVEAAGAAMEGGLEPRMGEGEVEVKLTEVVSAVMQMVEERVKAPLLRKVRPPQSPGNLSLGPFA